MALDATCPPLHPACPWCSVCQGAQAPAPGCATPVSSHRQRHLPPHVRCLCDASVWCRDLKKRLRAPLRTTPAVALPLPCTDPCDARRTVCDPYLTLSRGLIPPLGGTLDFSPILAFVVLNVRAPASPARLLAGPLLLHHNAGRHVCYLHAQVARWNASVTAQCTVWPWKL